MITRLLGTVRLKAQFITAHGDIPMSVQALKAGAVDFLTKPFRDQQLLGAVQQAIDRDRAIRRQREELAELRRRYDTLTQREREVMTLVVTGLLTKQIASQLRTSEATVKAHRAQLTAEDGRGLRRTIGEDGGKP